ncbi:MAG: 3-phosphoshikimate 1-carboxyvinyltransferase [Clostridiales bacterium]
MLIEQRDSLIGEINVPGDKSISHRAIVFASIAKGLTEIEGLLIGEDCLRTIDCFRKMNVSIDILSNNKVHVHGNGLFGLKPPTSILNTGRSGTSLRLILGILSGQSFNSSITRQESVIKKPVGRVVYSLKKMGASISGKDHGKYCPLQVSPSTLNGITEELHPYDTHIKSPLLLAGLYANGKTKVFEVAKSRDHSELMLNYFGANIKVDGLSVTSNPVENLYGQKIIVPGDISMAAFFITAGILTENSCITIKNVGINPTRTGILDVYKSMGANIELLNEHDLSNEKVADIKVSSSSLKGTIVKGEMIPTLFDEIPVIAVAATMAKGTTEIKNLKGFKIKTSGKLTSLVKELSKMGANIRETDDSLIIEGGIKPLKGTVVESSNDYSTAMALSVAGLIASKETMVRKAQIVDVVFPEFLSTLNSL